MTESDYLDSWDPLTDDYNDKNSNSYNTGAGANLPLHMQPANCRKDQNNFYVLWVRPLSSRYTEESLKNIFSSHGEVVDVSIIHPKSGDRSPFGYVVYKSQTAANNAIRGFNDNNTFEFKVNYAKDDSIQKLLHNLELKKKDYREYSKQVDRPDRSQRQSTSKSRTFSDFCDSVTDNNHEDRSSRNSRTNRSLKDSVTLDSPVLEKPERLSISFAFPQDIFPSEKKTSSRREHEPVQVNGLNSQAAELPIMKPVVYQALPQCATCQRKTFVVCSCCKLNFCNQECSMNGWRNHIGEDCIKVAALNHDSAIKPPNGLSNNGVGVPQPHFTNNTEFAKLAQDYTQTAKIYEDQSVFETAPRVNHLDNNYDNVDGVAYGSKRDTPKPDSRQRRPENRDSYDTESTAQKGEGNIGFDRRRNTKRETDEDRRGAGDARKSYPASTNYSRNNAQSRIDRNRRTEDDCFAPQANSSPIENTDVTPFLTGRQRLRLEKPVKVIVLSSVGKDECQAYVRFVEEEDSFKSFHTLLNEFKSFQPYSDGRKCVARYRNSWYRGLVVSNKSAARVRLIDDGIYHNFQKDELREIPESFAQVVPFAHFVNVLDIELEQLQSWASVKEIVTINPVKEEISNKTWFVRVIPEEPIHEQLEKARRIRDRVAPESVERLPSKKAASPKQSAALTSSSVTSPEAPKRNENDLIAGVPMKGVVSFVKDDRVFFVAKSNDLLDINLRLEKEDPNKLRPLVNIEPGVLCIGVFSDLCGRAKVLSKDPLRVVYIDYGNEEPVKPDDLKVLPASYENIPPLAIRVRLYEGTVTDNNVEENQPVIITPIEKEKNIPDSWIVCVGDKSSQFKELRSHVENTKPVAPKLQKSSSTTASVRSPTSKEPIPPVVMDACVTFAVSKSEYYCIKKADVGLFEATNSQMTDFNEITEKVEEGKVYAKLFEGLWCRAQVVDTSPLTIYFIDYGNTEICQPEELYELPEKLQKNPPPLAFRVSLKNETQELLDYGKFINVMWDIKADSYTLLRDPSATLDDDTVATGAVSSK